MGRGWFHCSLKIPQLAVNSLIWEVYTETRQTEPEPGRENRSESNFMKGFSRESSVRAKMNTNAIIRHRLFGSIQPILGPGMGCREGGDLKLQRLNFPIHIVWILIGKNEVSLSISDAVQMHQIKLFSSCSLLLLINCILQPKASSNLGPMSWSLYRFDFGPFSSCVGLCPPSPHSTTLVLVTNASPRLDPSTSSDMTLLLTTQHYQDRRFFIAWSSAVNYDFVAATVCTGKCTNIPPDILISLIFTKILGHLTLKWLALHQRDKIIFVSNIKRMFWANGQSWNMFVRETSRTGPWTQLWYWRGWNQAVSSGMKKLFQSDHTLLRWTLQYLLAVLVKTFPNRNSSRPTEFLRTLTPPPSPHLTQVFAQCVTISTVSNPLLHKCLWSHFHPEWK